MNDPESPISNLTPTEFGILNGLRIYRFLNVPQMEKLGIGKKKGQITHVLSDMVKRNKPAIGKIVPGTLPKLGRLPNLYYLTEYGAMQIADALQLDHDKVKYPKRVTTTSVHYWHRTHAIDCHIAVQKWADLHNNHVDYYHDYFEHAGSNRKSDTVQRSITRVEYSGGSIIPDAIFQLTDDHNKSRFFAFEVYNQNRPQRTLEKNIEYCHVLSEKALTQAFNYPYMPRILMVFERDADLMIHMSRVAQHPAMHGEALAELSDGMILSSLELFVIMREQSPA
jgi:hypothetical protein